MKCYHCLDPSVNYGLHCLPKDLKNPYPPGVCVTFGNQDQYLPTKLCWERATLPHVLYHLHQFFPSSQVEGGRPPYQICLPQPSLKVFVTDMSVYYSPVSFKLKYCFLQLLLRWNPVIYMEVGNVG